MCFNTFIVKLTFDCEGHALREIQRLLKMLITFFLFHQVKVQEYLSDDANIEFVVYIFIFIV